MGGKNDVTQPFVLCARSLELIPECERLLGRKQTLKNQKNRPIYISESDDSVMLVVHQIVCFG